MHHRLRLIGCRAWLCILLVLITSAFHLSAEEPEIVDYFYFPFVIDGVYVDDVEAGLDMFYEPSYLNTDELFTLLSPRMRAESIEFLKEAQWMTFRQLRIGGITVTYDPMTLEMKFSVPPAAAIPMTYSLMRVPITRFGTAVEPVDFSFYTNVYSSFTYRHGFEGEPLVFDSLILEPNLYHRNWTIESRLPFNNLASDSFELSNSWYVRGLTFSGDTKSRLIFEDTPGSGGDRLRSIIYEKSRTIGVTPRYNSTYELSLLVTEPSSLTLKLNDRNIFARRVSQGEYFFDGFSLNAGVNELTYVMEREGKDPIMKTILLPFDQSLMPRRENDYSIGVSFKGFEDLVTDPLKDLRFFGSLRLGLTHTLTSTYRVDISSLMQSHEIGFNLATLHGNYFHTSRVSIEDSKASYFGSLTYRYFDRLTNRSFGLTGTLNTRSSNADLAMSYSQTLFPSLSFSTIFGVTYAWEDDEPFNPRASTVLRHRLRINQTSSLLTDIAVTDWIDFTFQVSAYLSVNLANNRVTANARHTVTRSYDEDTKDFVTKPNTTVNALFRPDRNSPFGPVTLSLSKFDDSWYIPENIGLSGTYTDSYLSARLQQNVVLGNTVRYTTNLRVNTALAYADRTFAVSRPISNSFIMVKPGAALQGIDIGVNPRSGTYGASTDNIFNTALLPSLPAFSETALILEPFEIPDDVYFSEHQFRFSTRYKQAAVIRPGAEFRVMLTGRLFYREGDPLVFIAGDITPVDAVDEDDMQFFFTDDTGRLFAFDLSAGEYIMNIYLRDRTESIRLIIPEDVRGTATVGDIYLVDDRIQTIESAHSTLVTLTGKLFYSDQSPASFLRAELRDNGNQFPFITGENGFFSILELQPGRYELHLEDGITDDFLEFVIPDQLSGTVTVGDIYLSDMVQAPAVIELTNWVSAITGQVIHHQGNPLPFAPIELVPETNIDAPTYAASTDAEGQFSISEVQSGSYILGVSVKGRYYYYRIIVPDDTRGVLTLGTIMLPGPAGAEDRITVPASRE